MKVEILKCWMIAGCIVIGSSAIAVFAQSIEDRQAKHSTIAFISSRFDPSLTSPAWLSSAQIYLMNGDSTGVRRVTHDTYAEGFPCISPNGKRIVFESNRLRKVSDPLNWASLFVINIDGSGESALVPGNSATWSADSKRIAFHASASGTGKPITNLPGAAAIDSDIFVVNVDEFLRKKSTPKNITINPETVDDDPDWSPDGKKIVFTSHAITDSQTNSISAEIYVINADGSGKLTRLTNNNEEERAPDWSPDGKFIVYSCRKGDPLRPGGPMTFEICIMKADGSGQRRITNNNVAELTVTWSPDGKRLLFHRAVNGPGQFQLFVINADGTGEKQLTFPPGFNAFANWDK